MQRICAILLLLLSDERSAVERKAAARFSVLVLGTAVVALVLMSFGEQTYRDLDRRVLRASQDLASGPLV